MDVKLFTSGNNMKDLFVRTLLIVGVPISICCLFIGFWTFMGGNMTYSIPMMIIGFVFWMIIPGKYPKSPIRRR